MNLVVSLSNEFKIRVFEESYSRISKCLGMLSQEELWAAPNENTVSVGCLVKHLLGNAKQWIISGVFGEDDLRDRDAEFIPEPEKSAEDLLSLMQNLQREIETKLPQLTEAHLLQEGTIQGFETTGFSAMVHVIEHFSYHTGQISLLTKLFRNQDLGYYDNLDLNTINSK